LDDIGFVTNTSDDWYYTRVNDDMQITAPNQPR
jgi:hypothetical protein